MPLIEELPITQSHRTTHGWTYIPIPETGLFPIAAIQPGNRKRARDTLHTSSSISATVTAKQLKATQSRLDSLDKENYKDGVTVAIPTRQGKRDASRKMTANVRRILTYQRAFAHYLADEEANSTSTSGQSVQQPVGTVRVDGRRKSALTGDVAATGSGVSTPTTAGTSTPTAPRRGRPPASVKREREARERARLKGKEKEDENADVMGPPPKKDAKHEDKDDDGDTTMNDASTQSQAQSQTSASSTKPTTTPVKPPLPVSKQNYDASVDKHPLLRTLNLPKMPSARVMAALVAEPPLSYAAARAQPLTSDSGTSVIGEKPRRRFCAVCGYWGKIKCRGCGEWMCGIMDCYRGHGGVCIMGVGVYS